MKISVLTWLVFIGMFGVPAVMADDGAKIVYSADSYDPAADADKDLEAGKVIAKRDGRKILLLVGGDWCPWCRKLAKYIEDTESVRAVLASGYVVQKVNVSDETSNTGFLNPYPAIDGYPHLFILDADGKLLHSQDSGELEKSGSYDEAKLLAVLKQRKPNE